LKYDEVDYLYNDYRAKLDAVYNKCDMRESVEHKKINKLYYNIMESEYYAGR